MRQRDSGYLFFDHRGRTYRLRDEESSSDAMSLGHTMLVTPWSPERIVGISDTPETKSLPPLLIFEEVDPQVN